MVVVLMNAAEVVDSHVRPASLVERLPDGRLRCLACGHGCKLGPGKRGICQVRLNMDGRLMAPWGYVSGLQPDPIEKKPFFHFMPGSIALTFGMLGCNFHCDYCQNWFTSQLLRDEDCDAAVGSMRFVDARGVVQAAKHYGAGSVVSSYNEPFITTEWAAHLFDAAKEAGLRTAMVSNGYGSRQALRLLAPRMDGLKIDLKSLNDRTYRKLGGTLALVLDCIDMALEEGLWVEIVTLLVPGMNDSEEELVAMAEQIGKRGREIPWHISAFFPRYHRQKAAPTSAQSVTQAVEIGLELGLRHVYAGNLAGSRGGYEDSVCAGCGRIAIRRRGYEVESLLLRGGKCAHCGRKMAGVWE